jgi:glycosyltransferase involved in cell wall biosynthesis
MKIALLADSIDLQSAGIHSYTRELINLLTKYLPEHEYLIVRPRKGEEQWPNTRQLVVPVKKYAPGHQRWRQFRDIPRALKREKPDVVIEPAHFGPFNLPDAIKRVTVIHDLTPLLFPRFHPTASVTAHRLLLPRVVRKADRIVAVSRNTEKDLHRLYPASKGKTRVIYPAIPEHFSPDQNRDPLSKYGIRKPYFLFLGTIEPRKNLPLLIQAYEQFRRESPDRVTQLVLAGKYGWKSEPVLQKIEASPFQENILQCGYINLVDIPALMTHCQVFVYPSLYEGFGLPVAEALACGSVALTTRNGSLAEFAGLKNVHFFPDDRPAYLAVLLERFSHSTISQASSLPAFLEKARLADSWRALFAELYPSFS